MSSLTSIFEKNENEIDEELKKYKKDTVVILLMKKLTLCLLYSKYEKLTSDCDIFINNLLPIDETISNIDEEIIFEDLSNKIDLLHNNGHICIRILETYPPTISWCNQKKCIYNNDDTIESIESKNEKALKYAEKLESEGHTCVEILESYPIQIKWCHQKECVGKKVGNR